MYQNQPIKQWVVEDRPREKMLQKGMNALTDSEVLAIILGSGYKDASAVSMSQNMLRHVNNSLDAFAKLSFDQLCKFKGIGEAKAITLLASFELGRRRKIITSDEIIVHSSEQAYQLFYAQFSDLHVEEFHIALLNQRNKLIKTVKISQGGITSTLVDMRLIFKAALDVYATRIILAHNHPSGNLSPSIQDDKLTEKIVSFGKMIEINVIDHLVITNNGYFSYADKNLL